MQRLPGPRTYGFILALFRVYLGAFWISHGWPKLTDPAFNAPSGPLDQILRGFLATATGPYHDFLANTVLPNEHVFGLLVAYGEVLVGASLVLGLFSRLGALGGLFLATNYWLAKGGLTHLGDLGTTDFLTMVICAVNVLLPTGRVLGIDALMGRPAKQEVIAAPQPPPVYHAPPARPVTPSPAPPPPRQTSPP